MAQLRTSSRRGAALVEMAIVLKLLLVLSLGVIEYGWMMLKSQQISNASRVGARVGARQGATAADITAAITTAMTASNLAASGYTVTITPNDPTTLGPGALLTVEVSVVYANIDAVGLILIPTPTNLRSSVVMAREASS